MGKDKNPRRVADNEAMAVSRMLQDQPAEAEPRRRDDPQQAGRARRWPTSPSPRSGSARTVKKTLQSAIANAENNHGLDVDELVVAEAWVGKNLVLKRGQPAGARPLRAGS